MKELKKDETYVRCGSCMKVLRIVNLKEECPLFEKCEDCKK